MAKVIQQSPEQAAEVELRLPPVVPDGTYEVEDLGRFVNWITRATRSQRRVEQESVKSGLFMTDEEWESQGGDPELVEPPPPIPDGDDVGSRGGKPEDFGTK